MCGLAGAFALEGQLHPRAHDAVAAMTAALAHRGPDGDGFFRNDIVSLGHRRLAIIDRTGGDQPMANEDESCWIIFNGEIYNHRDLQPRLEDLGHRFRTHCDTEVILHAYEEFGPDCLNELEGMFAFVIYDGRRRQLFAARDRLGKKPFFYATLGGVLYFASELPPLVLAPDWRGEVDLTALEGYLSLGYFVAPTTIYKDARKLRPAHWLRVEGGQVIERRYWDVTDFDSDRRSSVQILKEVDQTLRTAVQDRLESEVPLGAFLSGGIDSGLVVSYMAEALGDRLVTASVGFGERGHDELGAAAEVAEYFKSSHNTEFIQPNLEECLEPVTRGLGEPLADASAIPTWYVSRMARQHVTVALSGDGGDETFTGYDFRYVPHAMEDAARAWVPHALRPALGWLGSRWPRWSRLPRPLRAGTVLENLGRDPAGAYYADLTFLKTADARRLMGLAPSRDVTRSPVYAAVTDPYRRCPSADAVHRSQYADLSVYLPNDPLVKVDRMSMAHGLEVRCPLLDRRVVELAFRIPVSRKQIGTRGKVLLRDLARRRLPSDIWLLPKHGFTAPISQWLAGPQAGPFEAEVLHSSAAISNHMDVRELARRFDEHRRGVTDSGYALWAAWVLERWLQSTPPARQTKPAPAAPGTILARRAHQYRAGHP